MATTKQTLRNCRVCSKRFKTKHDTSTIMQRLCSCKCAVIFYTDSKPKSRKLAREVAKMVGRRSMAEVKFDAKFIEGNKKINARYELDTFKYQVSEIRKYTPDWTVYTPNGRVVYLEYKGVLDGKTRKKMKLIKAQYPDIDLRIIFEKASNKIYKGSNTTYGEWADQHGFPWTDNVMPKDCRK